MQEIWWMLGVIQPLQFSQLELKDTVTFTISHIWQHRPVLEGARPQLSKAVARLTQFRYKGGLWINTMMDYMRDRERE